MLRIVLLFTFLHFWCYKRSSATNFAAAEKHIALRAVLLVDLSQYAFYPEYLEFVEDTIGKIEEVARKEENKRRSVDLSIVVYGACLMTNTSCHEDEFSDEIASVAVYRRFGESVESLKRDKGRFLDFAGGYYSILPARSVDLIAGVLSKVQALLNQENRMHKSDHSVIILITSALTPGNLLYKLQRLSEGIEAGNTETIAYGSRLAELYTANFWVSEEIKANGTKIFGIQIEGSQLTDRIPPPTTAARMGLPRGKTERSSCYLPSFIQNISSTGMGFCVADYDRNVASVLKEFLKTIADKLEAMDLAEDKKGTNPPEMGNTTPKVLGIIVGVVCGIAILVVVAFFLARKRRAAEPGAEELREQTLEGEKTEGGPPVEAETPEAEEASEKQGA